MIKKTYISVKKSKFTYIKSKNFILILFTIVAFLSVQSTLAQEDIGDFNRKELKIKDNIEERMKSLSLEKSKAGNSFGREKEYITELNQIIDKSQQLNSEIEERFLQCQNALRKLPEKSGEKTTNLEYKFWTEDCIKSYKALIEINKSRIQSCEDSIKHVKSSEQTKEVGTNKNEDEEVKANNANDREADDFWSDKPVTNSKNNEESAAKAKEEKKRLEQEKYQQTMAIVNANLEKTRQDSKEFEDKMVSKATGVVQSYYQGQAALESKSNINSLSKLTGDYSSIDELERDFNTQYAQINQETSNFVESKKASINSRFDSSTSTDSNDAMGNEAMKLIGGLITDIEANRARKKALEELEAQKQAKLKEIEAAKINQRISLRTKLVDAFPNGGLPLSSHRITAKNVYLFAYITNKAQFGNENVDIAISNVFPVAQYSDGTFPYKNGILNQLNGFGKGEVTIVGYYTDEATAKETHETFTKLAHKTGMKVNPFSFKKEATNKSSNAKTSTTDFWETSKKEQPKNEKKETKSDFWND